MQPFLRSGGGHAGNQHAHLKIITVFLDFTLVTHYSQSLLDELTLPPSTSGLTSNSSTKLLGNRIVHISLQTSVERLQNHPAESIKKKDNGLSFP
jgi:hypothetical protein